MYLPYIDALCIWQCLLTYNVGYTLLRVMECLCSAGLLESTWKSTCGDLGILGNIQLLASAYSFGDPEGSPIFDLPAVREFEKNRLDLLKSSIALSLKDSFQPPTTHVEHWPTVGVNSFLAAAGTWLGVSNYNTIRSVRGLVRRRYRANRHVRGNNQIYVYTSHVLLLIRYLWGRIAIMYSRTKRCNGMRVNTQLELAMNTTVF